MYAFANDYWVWNGEGSKGTTSKPPEKEQHIAGIKANDKQMKQKGHTFVQNEEQGYKEQASTDHFKD